MEDVNFQDTWHTCEGRGICIHCGATIHEYCYTPKDKEMKDQVGPVPIGSNNQDLIDQTKRIHGELYHRLNSIQRDLNITRETNKKQRAYIQELEATNRDLSRMQLPTPDNSQIPAPIMHALRMGGMPERFNTIESITDWIKLIVHL